MPYKLGCDAELFLPNKQKSSKKEGKDFVIVFFSCGHDVKKGNKGPKVILLHAH